jgi:hypothetical protein
MELLHRRLQKRLRSRYRRNAWQQRFSVESFPDRLLDLLWDDLLQLLPLRHLLDHVWPLLHRLRHLKSICLT